MALATARRDRWPDNHELRLRICIAADDEAVRQTGALESDLTARLRTRNEMKTLHFIDGVAQGLPEGWNAAIETHPNIGTAWRIWQVAYPCYLNSTASMAGFSTRDAAERSCEAALWLLGVLPLPEYGPDFLPPGSGGKILTLLPFQMVVRPCHLAQTSLANWSDHADWHILHDDGSHPRIVAECQIGNQSTAETVLRSLIASAVRDGGDQ